MGGFQFKQFRIEQDLCGMKVGTDGVLLGAWAKGGRHILDIGTGTGLIALMMAQRFRSSTIEAIDIEENAAKQAQDNIERSPFSQQIKVFHTSIQQFNSKAINYDAIVCQSPIFRKFIVLQ